VAVIPAVVLYLLEAPERKQSALQGSWEVVSRMEGKMAVGGRLSAIEHLRVSGEPLAGLVMNNAVITGLNLSESDLSLSRFENVRLASCSFAGSTLSEVILAGGRFEKRCDFTSASIDQANLERARFLDGLFDGARLLRSHGNYDTSFNGARFQETTISNSDLPGVDFDNANFTKAFVHQTALQHATFHRAILDLLRVSSTIAFGAQFQRAEGNETVFDSLTVLDGSNFDATRLRKPRFDAVSMRGVSGFGAHWTQAILRACDLTGADFTSANLEGGTCCDCVGAEEAFANATVKPMVIAHCELR
jgi:uncharacterized protein YjbI with pentapeptide repeats